MDVEIVLDQGDGLGAGEVDIGQLFQDVSIIYSGVAIRDFDMAPAFAPAALSCGALVLRYRRTVLGRWSVRIA